MTNPDNVGGLLLRALGCLELLDNRPRPQCRDCADNDGVCPSSGLDCDMRTLVVGARRELGELCRAAPAGGDEDKGPTPWAAGGFNIITTEKDSAPAGSGEVEEYDWDAAHEALESLDDYARMDVGVAPHGPYTVLRDLLTKAKGWQAAALLRKLQQGAEYVVVPREPTGEMYEAATEIDIASADGVCTEAIRLNTTEIRKVYQAMIAASQDQEGGKNA